jgi:hypothetical protein
MGGRARSPEASAMAPPPLQTPQRGAALVGMARRAPAAAGPDVLRKSADVTDSCA